jgi:hypothetical protein
MWSRDRRQRDLFGDEVETFPLPLPEERVEHLPVALQSLAKTILYERRGLLDLLHQIVDFNELRRRFGL